MRRDRKTNSQIRANKEKLVMENFASVMKKLDDTFLVEGFGFDATAHQEKMDFEKGRDMNPEGKQEFNVNLNVSWSDDDLRGETDRRREIVFADNEEEALEIAKKRVYMDYEMKNLSVNKVELDYISDNNLEEESGDENNVGGSEFTNVHEFIKLISSEKPNIKWENADHGKWGVYTNNHGGFGQTNYRIEYMKDGSLNSVSREDPRGTKYYESLEDFYSEEFKGGNVKPKSFSAYKSL